MFPDSVPDTVPNCGACANTAARYKCPVCHSCSDHCRCAAEDVAVELLRDPETRARGVKAFAEIAKREVLEQIRYKFVPDDVPDFEHLHDHIDANMLGPVEQLMAAVGSEAAVEAVAEVQDIVDAWLRAGRP